MRDVKISNGGIAFESTYTTEKSVIDMDAVFQRIEFALSVKKGDFPYNKAMGITIPNLSYIEERDSLILEMFINEAIYDICDYSCKIKKIDLENSKVTLQITVEDNIYEKEVKIGGKLQ